MWITFGSNRPAVGGDGDTPLSSPRRRGPSIPECSLGTSYISRTEAAGRPVKPGDDDWWHITPAEQALLAV